MAGGMTIRTPRQPLRTYSPCGTTVALPLTFTEMWRKPTTIQTFAAFLPDPSGTSFWHLLTHSRLVSKRSAATGNLVAVFDLDELIGQDGVHIAGSAMTIADTASGHAMLITGAAVPQGPFANYLAAIDISASPPTLIWATALPAGFIPEGQFPIVTNGTGGYRIIVSGDGPGVRAIGTP